MDDNNLKHDLASKYADDFRTASRDDAYGSFIDGWDAARANEGTVSKELFEMVCDERDLFEQERNQLRAELERMDQLAAKWQAEYANALEAAEKLAEALEFYATEWRSDVYVGPTNDLLADFGKRAQDALAEYREKFKK